MYDSDSSNNDEYYNSRRRGKKKNCPKPWTEEDQTQLVKLMAKYPGGTLDRWAVISKVMDRPVAMITTKAKLAKQVIGQYFFTLVLNIFISFKLFVFQESQPIQMEVKMVQVILFICFSFN